MVRETIEEDWRQEKQPYVDEGCRQVTYGHPGELLLRTYGDV